MRVVRGKNEDVLSDTYRMHGTTLEGAACAFGEIERKTKLEDVDLSILTFLSPIEETQDGLIHTVHLDGEQKMEWDEDQHALSMDVDQINIKFPEGKHMKVEYPVMVTGGICKTPVRASDESLFFMSNAALHQLQKSTCVTFAGKASRNILRDCAFAYKCAEMKEHHATVVYRENDGIKKIVGCYENKPEMPTFADILEAANYASKKTGRCYVLKNWEITQYFRKVKFVAYPETEGEKEHVLEYCWSDCGQKRLSVTSHIRGGKVTPKVRALKEASVTASLASA